MNERILRLYIRAFLLEEKQTLGEPDTTAETMRDEPQPQYEDEEDTDNDKSSDNADEASTVAGLGGGLGPMQPLEYDPEKKVLDPWDDEDEDDK
jgi:hypothetical protein